MDALFEWFNHCMVEWLDSQIGKPISVQYHGATICLHVTLDITMPLKKLLVIEHEDEEKRFLLEYEKLAYFCYACCCLNHKEKNCFAADIAGETHQFRVWVR